MYTRKSAILIGVPEYAHDLWSPLPYVRNDIAGADGLERVLAHDLGDSCRFETLDIHVPDPQTPNGQLKNILWSLCTRPDDSEATLLVVYFSGHGALHPITKRASLVTYNTDPDDPDSTGIP